MPTFPSHRAWHVELLLWHSLKIADLLLRRAVDSVNMVELLKPRRILHAEWEGNS